MAKKLRAARAQPAVQTAGYILSPRIDFWMTGGLSVVVMLLLLIYIAMHGLTGPSDPAKLSANIIIFQALINWPHFMGAYRLLYRPAANIKKYPVAAIYVPIALLLAVIASVVAGNGVSWSRISVNQDIAYLFWLAAAFYLAWHYTGQAWGMIATFSRLSHRPLSNTESLVVRVGLRCLLVWHVVWGSQDLPARWLGGLHDLVPTLLQAMSLLCVTMFFAGIVVWIRMRKRTGALVDARVFISWLAIYLWYLVLYFMPSAYPVVQLSHALQYLAFPLRVELNATEPTGAAPALARPWHWGLKYYAFLIGAGLLVFYVPELLSDLSQTYTFALVITSAVSIHHYVVDGCIWKVGKPDVRRRLLAHLAPERPARA